MERVVRNKSIRDMMKKAGLFQWEVAEAMNWNEYSFSKALRRKLPEDKKQEVIRAICKLINRRK